MEDECKMGIGDLCRQCTPLHTTNVFACTLDHYCKRESAKGKDKRIETRVLHSQAF